MQPEIYFLTGPATKKLFRQVLKDSNCYETNQHFFKQHVNLPISQLLGNLSRHFVVTVVIRMVAMVMVISHAWLFRRGLLLLFAFTFAELFEFILIFILLNCKSLIALLHFAFSQILSINIIN